MKRKLANNESCIANTGLVAVHIDPCECGSTELLIHEDSGTRMCRVCFTVSAIRPRAYTPEALAKAPDNICGMKHKDGWVCIATSTETEKGVTVCSGCRRIVGTVFRENVSPFSEKTTLVPHGQSINNSETNFNRVTELGKAREKIEAAFIQAESVMKDRLRRRNAMVMQYPGLRKRFGIISEDIVAMAHGMWIRYKESALEANATLRAGAETMVQEQFMFFSLLKKRCGFSPRDYWEWVMCETHAQIVDSGSFEDPASGAILMLHQIDEWGPGWTAFNNGFVVFGDSRDAFLPRGDLFWLAQDHLCRSVARFVEPSMAVEMERLGVRIFEFWRSKYPQYFEFGATSAFNKRVFKAIEVLENPEKAAKAAKKKPVKAKISPKCLFTHQFLVPSVIVLHSLNMISDWTMLKKEWQGTRFATNPADSLSLVLGLSVNLSKTYEDFLHVMDAYPLFCEFLQKLFIEYGKTHRSGADHAEEAAKCFAKVSQSYTRTMAKIASVPKKEKKGPAPKKQKPVVSKKGAKKNRVQPSKDSMYDYAASV